MCWTIDALTLERVVFRLVVIYMNTVVNSKYSSAKITVLLIFFALYVDCPVILMHSSQSEEAMGAWVCNRRAPGLSYPWMIRKVVASDEIVALAAKPIF